MCNLEAAVPMHVSCVQTSLLPKLYYAVVQTCAFQMARCLLQCHMSQTGSPAPGGPSRRIDPACLLAVLSANSATRSVIILATPAKQAGVPGKGHQQLPCTHSMQCFTTDVAQVDAVHVVCDVLLEQFQTNLQHLATAMVSKECNIT